MRNDGWDGQEDETNGGRTDRPGDGQNKETRYEKKKTFSLASDIFARTTTSTSRSEISARIIWDKEMRIVTGMESPREDKTE